MVRSTKTQTDTVRLDVKRQRSHKNTTMGIRVGDCEMFVLSFFNQFSQNLHDIEQKFLLSSRLNGYRSNVKLTSTGGRVSSSSKTS